MTNDREFFVKKSRLTGKEYNTLEHCRILNLEQALRYLANGVELIDIYPSRDKENPEKHKCVFVFNRKDSAWAYDAWCRHELKYPDDVESAAKDTDK